MCVLFRQMNIHPTRLCASAGKLTQIVFGHRDVVTCLARSESYIGGDCYRPVGLQGRHPAAVVLERKAQQHRGEPGQ